MPLLPRRLPLFMPTVSHHLLAPLTPSHRLLISKLKIAPARNVHFALRSNRVKPPRPLSIPARDVHTVALNHELDLHKRFKILNDKLQELGFNYYNYVPGQFNSQMCPKCQGGDAKEKSLSICIKEDGRVALWRCFRGKCGWSGVVQDGKMEKFYLSQGEGQALNTKKGCRVISEEELGLEPLCKEVLAYLNERMISTETLRRNRVMQRRSGNQTVIAFTYRRNGILVSCKYRGIDKKFWQVEGEIDKIAMEEAGYCNCISVPDGAPSEVSNTLPEQEKIKMPFSSLRPVFRAHTKTDAPPFDPSQINSLQVCTCGICWSYSA